MSSLCRGDGESDDGGVPALKLRFVMPLVGE